MNREQKIRFNKSRFRKELKKRRKQKNHPQVIKDEPGHKEYAPNILAMIKTKKDNQC